MNWITFGKVIAKLFAILNLIRKTANEQGWSIEGMFSLLDDENGKEALKTATRVWLQEESRLRIVEIEMIEASEPMSHSEALKWAEQYKSDGWRFPTKKDYGGPHQGIHLQKYFSHNDNKYWLLEGWSVDKHTAGLYGVSRRCTCDKTPPLRRACVIRELPKKTWQLV
jgi:hypothetical protein